MKLLAALMLMVFGCNAIAVKQGPESGGGGGVAAVNGRPRLIDYYTIKDGTEYLSEAYVNKRSSVLIAPVTLKFERDVVTADPAFLKALDLFNQWSSLPYDTIGLWISGAMSKPIWSFTDSEVTAPSFYKGQFLPSNAKIYAAAYYSIQARNINVSISRQIWNQLSLQDQTGLIIHETLRHVQLGLSFSFNDEALQKATAMMMICKPRIKFNQYLFYMLNNRIDLAEQNFAEKFDVLTQECWSSK